MNTPAHLLVATAAFGRPARPGITAAALVGAIIPDLSLYLMAGWHLFVLKTPPDIVFNELYYSEAWQSIFRIDNSFILWGIGLALALRAKSQVAIAFFGAGLLHIGLDFPLHNDDARAHFWPLTNWVFYSPVSYWDPRHYGNIFGILEVILCALCTYVIWRRFPHWPMRAFSAVLFLAEFLPVFAWIFMMGDGS